MPIYGPASAVPGSPVGSLHPGPGFLNLIPASPDSTGRSLVLAHIEKNGATELALVPFKNQCDSIIADDKVNFGCKSTTSRLPSAR
jgi:hypothetical protein